MATKSQNKTADEKKTAGEDKSKDVQTTDQAAEKQDALQDAKVEERGETDAKAAASGGSVGAVRDGDSNVVDKDDDERDSDFDADAFEDGSVAGASGVVAERNAEGDEFDVPYAYVTAADLARTSDSDDPAKDWTAQHAAEEREDQDHPVALVPVEGTPGQTFRVRELPNREVVEAAGINYEQWVAGLPVRADVPNEAPRKGIPA